MHTFFENNKLATGNIPFLSSATITGGEIDAQGAEIQAFVFGIGNSLDTLSGSVLWTLTIEESDTTSSGFTTVAAADIKGIVDHTAASILTGNSVIIDAPAEDSRYITFEYGGEKRFLRAVITITGTHTNGTPLSILNVTDRENLSPVVG